ncbi:FAD-binding protein [Pasteurella sp. PK-2025]|uniref:FAD-binding protein n=1 Tax=Pasteurella sp. PK-2025 TaxID=3413133 RepID=UPI003C70B1A7
MTMIRITKSIQTELLIVGSGIAGLSCAVEAYKKGLPHVLICKTQLATGASFFPLKATLGIQVTGEEQDKPLFIQDIQAVAQGMNNPKIVQAYVEDSPHAVHLLAEIGFQPWKRQDHRPACFAKHPRPIYLINAWKAAAKRAKNIIGEQNTTLFEQTTLLHIVVDNQQVQGAVFMQPDEQGEIQYVFCQTPNIILATGGIAGLYKDNLYPADVIGSSHFVALQAGATLTNLEYIQFIPSFIEPKYKVLFGEHTLKYCKAVEDHNGQSLFHSLNATQLAQMMTARSHYAPFSVDFPCVAFDLGMMQYLMENPEQEGVYLRYDEALYQDQEEFYQVYLRWLEQEAGIHLLRDKVSIAPFAHSCNGGIEIDEYAESRVKGLFAVGEIASCIEGANRLGGNSVGGCLVFAKRALQKISQKPPHFSPSLNLEQAIAQAEDMLNQLNRTPLSAPLPASQVLSQLRQAMSKFANVYRTGEALTQLLAKLTGLEQQFNPFEQAKYQGIEIYYALKTAQLLVQSMLQREESRGAHYRADFPQKSPECYRLQVRWEHQQVNIQKCPVSQTS